MTISSWIRLILYYSMTRGPSTTCPSTCTAPATCPSTFPSTWASLERYGFQTKNEPKHLVNLSKEFDADTFDLHLHPYDIKVSMNDSITFHVDVDDNHVDTLPRQRDHPRGHEASPGALLPHILLYQGEASMADNDYGLGLEDAIGQHRRATHTLINYVTDPPRGRPRGHHGGTTLLDLLDRCFKEIGIFYNDWNRRAMVRHHHERPYLNFRLNVARDLDTWTLDQDATHILMGATRLILYTIMADVIIPITRLLGDFAFAPLTSIQCLLFRASVVIAYLIARALLTIVPPLERSLIHADSAQPSPHQHASAWCERCEARTHFLMCTRCRRSPSCNRCGWCKNRACNREPSPETKPQSPLCQTCDCDEPQAVTAVTASPATAVAPSSSPIVMMTSRTTAAVRALAAAVAHALAALTALWLSGAIYLALTACHWLDVALYHVLSLTAICYGRHAARLELYSSWTYRARYASALLHFWTACAHALFSARGMALLALAAYPHLTSATGDGDSSSSKPPSFDATRIGFITWYMAFSGYYRVRRGYYYQHPA